MILETVEGMERDGLSCFPETEASKDIIVPDSCHPDNRGLYVLLTKFLLALTKEGEGRSCTTDELGVMKWLTGLLLQSITYSPEPIRIHEEKLKSGKSVPSHSQGVTLQVAMEGVLDDLLQDPANIEVVGKHRYLGALRLAE